MEVINELNVKIIPNDRNYFFIESGNLHIEYYSDKKIYILTRTDGKPFDGITEYDGGSYYGNMKPPQSFDDLITKQLELLLPLQLEIETKMFDKFYYHYNEDNTKLIIEPVFEELKVETFDTEVNIKTLVKTPKRNIRNLGSK